MHIEQGYRHALIEAGKTTLAKHPEYAKYLLEELGWDLDSSCQEVRRMILLPLKNCAKLLQPFHITRRGRDTLATLHKIIEHTEGMITHWEAKSNEIAETLRGEREHKLPEEPIAIG